MRKGNRPIKNQLQLHQFEQMNKLPAHHRRDNFDISKCMTHRLANSYGMPLNYSSKCSCCGKLTQKQQLTLNFSLVKIYYCGPQLASYLVTIKYLVILLFLLCLINALPLMLINYKGKCCEKKLDCSHSFLIYYSVFNQLDQHKRLNIESYIIFANYIVCIIFCQFLRKQVRKIKSDIDETNLFPSEFAILCGLPASNLKEKAIADAIEKWWKLQLKYNQKQMKRTFPQFFSERRSTSYHQRHSKILPKQIMLSNSIQTSQFIQQIIFSYDYKQYLQYSDQINPSEPSLREKGEMNDHETQLPTSCKKDSILRLSTNKFCLVIFKEKKYAKYFFTKNSPSFIEKLICFDQFRYVYTNQKELELTSELYPCEISWKNHHLSKSQKLKPSLLSIGITFLLSLCGCGFILLLTVGYIKYLQNSQHVLSSTYYVLVAIFINLAIIIGNKIVTIFSQQEKHATYASHKISCVYKLVTLDICLLLVSPFIVFNGLDICLLWKSNGFVETEITAFAIYLLLNQFQRYLSLGTLKQIKGYFDFLKSVSSMPQDEANKICNKPPHYIEQQYAKIITVLFVNFFLSFYIPFITILSCIWMFLHYWIEKANISYIYGQDEFHSHHLNQQIIGLIEFSFSFMLLGDISVYLISNNYFDQHFEVSQIFLCCFFFICCFLYAFIPREKLNAQMFNACKQRQLSDEISAENNYIKVKHTFLNLFEDFNEAMHAEESLQLLNNSEKRRIDATEEMRTIEASLSLSLKERLINTQGPIINQANQHQYQGYFQYEKKIIMKKVQPKVDIPPLFSKNSNLRNSIILKRDSKYIQ